jgi:hypothetical protein
MNQIEAQAYTELLITCQVIGCNKLFENCLKVPASDPVEDWAARMAKDAADVGWNVNSIGQILCPMHSSMMID